MSTASPDAIVNGVAGVALILILWALARMFVVAELARRVLARAVTCVART